MVQKKMNSKAVQLFSFFVVSSFFVTLLIPASASATSIQIGSDKASCVAGMKVRDSRNNVIHSNQKIKDYANDRIAKREATLNQIDKLLAPTRNNYNYYNTKTPVVQSAIEAINAKRGESLGGIAHDPASDFTFASVPARTLDISTFESVYANARNVINTAKTDANHSPTNQYRGEFMNAACSVIWDAQVYSTVLPVAKKSYILSRVDILNLMNSGLNVSRQKAIAGVYKDKKASDPTFDADGSIAGSGGFTANPLAEQGALAGVAQQAGDVAAVVALNSQLNTIAETILDYNSNGDLGGTFTEVLSTPAIKQ